MEQNIRGDTATHQAAKEDALGDMFVYMMGYANKNGIDLQDAFEKTWDSVKCRDWVKFPKDGLTE
jgi:NTP pyrophosphatase (non-canonical NTP hydrolase)